jgi:hypothetical protein
VAQGNLPLLAFNRGVVGKTTLARVDLDRVRLSASVMENWLPKKQGPMRIRPGTKYLGSSRGDAKAYFIEFVNATDDTALVELSADTGATILRVWDDDVLTTRVPVTTTVSFSGDTGWTISNIGGGLRSAGTPAVDQLPTMTSATTSGVTASASTFDSAGLAPWRAADDNNSTQWVASSGSDPQWWKVDFGSGNEKKVQTVKLTARPDKPNGTASHFRVQASATGGSDSGEWNTIIRVGSGTTYSDDTGQHDYAPQTGWASAETRTFTTQNNAYSTQPSTYRYWRVYCDANASNNWHGYAEVQLFDQPSNDTGQVLFTANKLLLNAGASDGSLARVIKTVETTDTGEEHALYLAVERGPVTIRVGTTSGDDDLIAQSNIGTGYHNLAFEPGGTFYITLQSDAYVDKIVSVISISDTGTLELPSPWDTGDIDNVRFDQSADVIYVDQTNRIPRKIERRGTGNSWSIVEYQPTDGPFLSFDTSSAKLSINARTGNATLSSDIPFFRSGHVGSLFTLTHEGQSGVWSLGKAGAVTDAITVTGIADTGAPTADNERRLVYDISGVHNGTCRIERSFDDESFGFKKVTQNYADGDTIEASGAFSGTIDDDDDNVKVWYRVKRIHDTGDTSQDPGYATVTLTYENGQTEGICRVTEYTDNQNVEVEILSRFSDTGTAESWSEGAWSGVQGYPGAVALHEGRLAHAGNANIWMSVSDDYESFDGLIEGEAGPIIKTLGSGPVDTIHYLVSLLRLVAGTTGSEIAIKSSSFDEVLTPKNSSARTFGNEGSMALRALKIGQEAFFVSRTEAHGNMVGFGDRAETSADYSTTDVTLYTEDILSPGVVSVAVQRKPDTRIHCVLKDGTVAILTYEPQTGIEVLAWSKWTTRTGDKVLRAMVLPSTGEDEVYYHVERTVNGATVRYLEKWAKESEANGDTGLSFLVDCAASNTDATTPTSVPGWTHLQGEYLVAWANDTGQSNSYGRDLSPDTGTDYEQTRYYVNKASDTGDTGKIKTDTGYKHVVAGLPYTANFKTAKLPFGGEQGTAMTQLKRVDKMGLVLLKTHRRGLYFGSDTGDLDAMPEILEDGAQVDADRIFEDFDQVSVPFPGLWNTDSRVYLRGKSPRPVTVMAAVPSITTKEK